MKYKAPTVFIKDGISNWLRRPKVVHNTIDDTARANITNASPVVAPVFILFVACPSAIYIPPRANILLASDPILIASKSFKAPTMSIEYKASPINWPN